MALLFSYLYHASNQMSHQDPSFNPRFFLFMLYRMVFLQGKYKSYFMCNVVTKSRTPVDEISTQHIKNNFQKLAEDLFKQLPLDYQNIIKNVKKDSN
jgi:hypothetical protein